MAGHLPLEILDHIFALSQGPVPTWEHDATTWRREQENPNLTLLCASLVNKTWASAAERALYRHAIFTAKPGQNTYISWIDSAARNRHRTVSLWIRPWARPEFGQVLDSCEGLEMLALGEVFSLNNFVGYPSWEYLCTPSLKDLKSLSIPTADAFTSYNRCTLPFSLSSLHLLLPADSTRLPRLSSTLLVSSQDTLHSLRLRITGDYRVPFPTNLFPTPLAQVRHLIVEEEYASFTVDEDEEEDLPVVTSLSNILASSSPFSSLENLELRGLYPKSRRPPGFFSSTIDSLPLPATVLRLILPIKHTDNLDEVIDMLDEDSDALKRLEVVEFPGLSIGDVVGGGDGQLERVRAFCRGRSIRVVWEDGEEDLGEVEGALGRERLDLDGERSVTEGEASS